MNSFEYTMLVISLINFIIFCVVYVKADENFFHETFESGPPPPIMLFFMVVPVINVALLTIIIFFTLARFLDKLRAKRLSKLKK